MGGMIKRYRFENKGFQYKRRCDLCHHARTELYRAQFEEGGPQYWLCPGQCLQQAQANYHEKRDKGIVPQADKQDFGEMNEQIRTSNEDNIMQE